MKPELLWERFCRHNADLMPETLYHSCWAFGGGGRTADKLAALVMAGIKTATSSAYPCYAVWEEKVPEAGDYSVIADAEGEAVCVLRTVKVDVVPFKDVGEEFAAKEGEGDQSLAFWRKTHAEAFGADCRDCGTEFGDETPVVCEEFKIVFQ